MGEYTYDEASKCRQENDIVTRVSIDTPEEKTLTAFQGIVVKDDCKTGKSAYEDGKGIGHHRLTLEPLVDISFCHLYDCIQLWSSL